MSKPRQGRIDIAQNLIKALELAAPMNYGIEVVKALKAEEARTLRVCSVQLRKEASKVRAKEPAFVADRAAAAALEHFADKFLHEAQALEKEHAH
jgi:hypothetical protein